MLFRSAKIAPAVKKVCEKYGVKATLAVRNHSTLVLNIKSGLIDFIGNYNKVVSKSPRFIAAGFKGVEGSLDVNPYWYQEHFDGKALAFFKEVFPLLNTGNHDNSDIMTDYFDVGWYVDVNIGKWDKPYVVA